MHCAKGLADVPPGPALVREVPSGSGPVLGGERAESTDQEMVRSVGDGGVDDNSDFRLYARASVLARDAARLASEHDTASGPVPVSILNAAEGAALYGAFDPGVRVSVSMLRASTAVHVRFLRAEFMRLAPVGGYPHGCSSIFEILAAIYQCCDVYQRVIRGDGAGVFIQVCNPAFLAAAAQAVYFSGSLAEWDPRANVRGESRGDLSALIGVSAAYR